MTDAWESVEVSERVVRTESQTRYEYDLNTETVTPIQEEVEVVDSVGTGTFERRLKEGVRFDEMTGKFYLTQTLENVLVDAPATPELAQWIQDRLPVTDP